MGFRPCCNCKNAETASVWSQMISICPFCPFCLTLTSWKSTFDLEPLSCFQLHPRFCQAGGPRPATSVATSGCMKTMGEQWKGLPFWAIAGNSAVCCMSMCRTKICERALDYFGFAIASDLFHRLQYRVHWESPQHKTLVASTKPKKSQWSVTVKPRLWYHPFRIGWCALQSLGLYILWPKMTSEMSYMS